MPTISISQQHRTNTTALGGNLPFSGLEWRASHKPEYHVYIFNISARTFEKVGRLNLTIPGVIDEDPSEVMVDGKKVAGDTKYHYCTSFPNPILISREKIDENEIGYIEQDGVRFVVDMITPDNPTRSLDFIVKAENTFSQGTNLAEKGVLFSLSNPPQKIDVEKAVKRLETYYQELVNRANVLDLTDKAELQRQLTSNPDIAFAASYFGREFSWNKKQAKQIACDNCGETKPAGRKFHKTSFDTICVEPTVDGWKAAVLSGAKRYEDVPTELRWKESVPAPKGTPNKEGGDLGKGTATT